MLFTEDAKHKRFDLVVMNSVLPRNMSDAVVLPEMWKDHVYQSLSFLYPELIGIVLTYTIPKFPLPGQPIRLTINHDLRECLECRFKNPSSSPTPDEVLLWVQIRGFLINFPTTYLVCTATHLGMNGKVEQFQSFDIALQCNEEQLHLYTSQWKVSEWEVDSSKRFNQTKIK